MPSSRARSIACTRTPGWTRFTRSSKAKASSCSRDASCRCAPAIYWLRPKACRTACGTPARRGCSCWRFSPAHGRVHAMPPTLSNLSRRYRVTSGSKFRLKHFRPDDDRGTGLRKSSQELLDQSVDRMAALQERMYAQDRWAVLLIFQALDAAGKDGTIKHVMSGLNPQSCEVHPFKSPSPEEIDHDFMWRTSKLLPRRGHIGIFNRSYYEEVLIVRVHPEILAAQRVPQELVGKRIWDERYRDITNFESYLSRQG